MEKVLGVDGSADWQRIPTFLRAEFAHADVLRAGGLCARRPPAWLPKRGGVDGHRVVADLDHRVVDEIERGLVDDVEGTIGQDALTVDASSHWRRVIAGKPSDS